jgi:hypothetical protein
MPLAETAVTRIGYGALTRSASHKTGSAFDAGSCLTRGHSTAEGATGGCAEHQLSSKASDNPAQPRATPRGNQNGYLVIRLGEMGSLAGKVSSTASSTSFSWR